ncbi:hypothetical protein FQR65_LT15844 [Abscondita terminalis]|nr:hypothetical protein FQR65_LT15844 [Abscondita terminalis]
MEHTGLWVALVIVVFVLGSIFGLRVSPREKALGLMREKARKMGLHPRLVAAPEWTKIPMATESRATLMRACVEDEKLHVIQGDAKFKDFPIALKGIYAIDMQANCVGLYWDEESDLRATQLDDMKAYLLKLAEI